MTHKRFDRAIIIRLICTVALAIAAAYLFFVRHQLFWSAVIMLAVIGLVINTIFYFNLINKWIASFLLGIENEDTTLKIQKKPGTRLLMKFLRDCTG